MRRMIRRIAFALFALWVVGCSSSSSNGPSGPAAQGAPCTTNADCGAGLTCGFATADGCSAKGSCLPPPPGKCDAVDPGCACDGTTTVQLACNGLPNGYAPAPVAYAGLCIEGGPDAGDGG